ncbi:MAG TPA: M1 family metallopeptidase [Gemmatimonadaceae bacterium]|nr:M1 family metallopeptidase [Gemmatimonadaceae bacterium]
MTTRPSRRSRLSAAVLPALLAVGIVAAVRVPAADTLPMPRAVARTYVAGTRSPDGRPGPNYWQNHGRYAITLTVAPPDRTVSGSETITYWNESPDTLRGVVIKLFLNIHKPGAPRAGGASPDYLTSGVHIDAYSVNGQRTAWQDNPRIFTWQPVRLPAPLAPHDSVRLAFDWHYEISKEAGREGMLDSTTYYLAYFYPRVAVYDDYNGWDTMDFTDQQEFYSDFNDYDVTVRAPANFIVWGTGTLANADQLLQPSALQRYRASFTADTTIHVATLSDVTSHRVTRQDSVNAWHFTARNVPDVAFAVSDHYVWDAASVPVDDAAHRRASVQAAFNDTAQDFHHMVRFAHDALDYFSHQWPGVPYPYEKSTVVQGGADMEYPMMVNDGSNADTTFSRFVVEHEIAHTYFPFYMGINETRYGFMDEGWATTFEYLISVDHMGLARESEFYKQFRVNGWIHDPSPLADIPIITPEDVLKDAAYGDNAYGKPSLGYLALRELLGDAMFRKCLHAYIDRWHGKHPTPWDFFNTFNDVSGKNLDWFWRGWYFSSSHIDLAIGDVRRSSRGYEVAIDNVGGMPAPFTLVVTYTDGSADSLHQTPAVWEQNAQRTTVMIPGTKTVGELQLDGGIWVDADARNDRRAVPAP